MHRNLRTLAAISSLALAFNFTSAANANETSKTVVTKALSQTSIMLNPSEAPLSSLAPLTTSSALGGYSTTFAESAALKIPSNPENPIQITSRNGSTIFVGLPFSKQAKMASLVTDGAVAFDNQNGSVSTVLAKTDGSLQIATVLTTAKAPTDFTYQLTLPTGVKAAVEPNGGVEFLLGNSIYIGGVAPAWARDSRGATIPTHYVVSGSTLTQVIEHQSLQYAYPIVADPWLGFDLIDHTAWTKDSPYSPTLNVYPTGWGRTVAFSTTYPLGGLILGTLDLLSVNAAWSETLALTTRAGHPNPDTQSMFLQFECHFFYVSKYNRDKVSWNLDSLRPFAPLATQIASKCNPK
jgi:hypothetical protein